MPWSLVDFQVFNAAVPMAAPGVDDALPTAIPLPPVGGGQLVRIERLSVGVVFNDFAFQPCPVLVQVFDQTPGPTIVPGDATTLWTTQDTIQLGEMLYDVADDSAPITVTQGNTATVVFTPLVIVDSSTIAIVRAQLLVYQGVAGQPTPVAGSVPGPQIPVGL